MMNYEIVKASLDNAETLTNLMKFYIYDFSEFIEAHIEENGRFGDYSLNDYWKDDNRFPYLVRFNGNYAGFVLVNNKYRN